MFAYKPVSKKVRPVPGTLPEEFRIIRLRPGDPLADMPRLPFNPPEFTPGKRYTQERYEAANIDPFDFLWPEEKKLVHWMIKAQEDGFAWNELERGTFRHDYLPPVRIPTKEHIPWIKRHIPIPPGIYDQVLQMLRTKILAGTLEPSNSSYQTGWFCVKKKEAGAIRMVIDLQPLNAVTIQDSSIPPVVEHMAESFAGRACYGMFDLIVAFDQRTLAEESRDLTTIQTPFGALRYTVVPMGYTNAVQILQGDITHILAPEIPEHTMPFVDDCPLKGPKTRYETQTAPYFETIKENPGIRRFVWEHMQNANRIVQRVKHAGGTFSAKKLFICVPEMKIVGHVCTYEGRIPDKSKVQKIKDWPACETVSEVRGFLGTCGILRIFIRDFSYHARPLVHLTRKEEPFVWEEAQQISMDTLKTAVINSPALKPIDYASGREVILAVDSSYIAVGFILFQLGHDGRTRFPNRFGSIAWNERESRYSQAKIELFGLFRALRAYRMYLVGVTNLTVEVDAKYIKGMIDNPDIQPNATINRWIAGILLFTFKLVHVPGSKHGPDGLSRRRKVEEDPEEEDDWEEWLDREYGFSMELLNFEGNTSRYNRESKRNAHRVTMEVLLGPMVEDEEVEIPRTKRAGDTDKKVERVRQFLKDPKHLPDMDTNEFFKFTKYASNFFTKGDQLWRKDPHGKHKLVLPPDRRLAVIREAHDDTGHKGLFSVRGRLLERFWWPLLEEDIRWFIKTCPVCQERQLRQFHITPPFIEIAVPFRKFHIDTMHLDKAGGYMGIIHARCATTSYPELRALRSETGKVVGEFIFQEILCRWGAIAELVTDNGSPFLLALEYLGKRYKIHHIRISAYNSQAQGIVERKHFDVRESLVKTANATGKTWPAVLHSVLWAERVTIQKSTGHSPYWMAHGVEPILPFDLAEATYLVPPPDDMMTTEDLIAFRARQLEKRPDDLAKVMESVRLARSQYIAEFMKRNRLSIRDYDFKPGDLVLVRNKAIETEHSRKMKPRYLGPMLVVRRRAGGAYHLAELDGTISKRTYAAFRVIPYHARRRLEGNITKLLNMTESALEELLEKEDIEPLEEEEEDDSKEQEGNRTEPGEEDEERESRE